MQIATWVSNGSYPRTFVGFMGRHPKETSQGRSRRGGAFNRGRKRVEKKRWGVLRRPASAPKQCDSNQERRVRQGSLQGWRGKHRTKETRTQKLATRQTPSLMGGERFKRFYFPGEAARPKARRQKKGKNSAKGRGWGLLCRSSTKQHVWGYASAGRAAMMDNTPP